MNETGTRSHYRYLDGALAHRTLTQEVFGIRQTRTPTETWMDWRGYDVHVDDWAPDGPARGTVILVHGGGGNGRLLAPFAFPLADAGLFVRAPDLPGYGLTRVPRDARVTYDAWVDLVVELANEASPRGPVFLFGMSAGGMTALWAAQRARHVAGVVVTTLLDLREPETLAKVARRGVGRFARAAFVRLPRLVDAVSFRLRTVTPIERLTRDPALQRALSADPLIGGRFVPGRLLRTMSSYAPLREDLALPCPLLLVHPGADDWTPVELSKRVYDRIPTAKELIVLDGGSHYPLESPAYGALCDAVFCFVGGALRS